MKLDDGEDKFIGNKLLSNSWKLEDLEFLKFNKLLEFKEELELFGKFVEQGLLKISSKSMTAFGMFEFLSNLASSVIKYLVDEVDTGDIK
ncbi:unnamed protein product [[Candida] boidinii]|nr:unnamed protein product [[Candida] boidinii]